MGKTESSYVTPPSPPSELGPEGSATRSYPGVPPEPVVGPGTGVSPDELTTGPAPLVPTDKQQTVISKRTPSGDSSFGPTPTPYELGRALEGQRLGHFELEEFVGGGGMGAVFRARDTQLGRTVAVKVLSRDQAADQETLRRFKNEAQSAARLDHENIARVHYVGEDSGWNYIVFEFIDGINLRDLVQQSGPLPVGQAVNFTLQVAEALSHAARRDVVHRDIKPSNVLIMSEGKAKLVDMGLARLHHMESDQGDLTASGVTLGTFDYISPEQARDPRSADVRSDLYSLGCTFYFMLTGRPPFPEGTVLQKLLSHSSEEPPDPRQFRADLPEEVTHILSKMLRKHPDDRYQEASELIGELLLMAERLGLPVAERGSAVWITPGHVRISPWERHLPWAVPVVLLVLIVLLLNFSTPSLPWDGTTPHRHRRPEFQVSSPEGGNDDSAVTSADASSEPADAATPTPAADPDVPDDPIPAAVGDDPADTAEPQTNGGESASGGAESAATAAPSESPEELADAGRDPQNDSTADPPDPENGSATVAAGGEAESPVEGTDPGGENGQVVDRDQVVIVGEGGEPSLKDALVKTAREKGEVVIELRFNGPMAVDSVRLVDRRLTIRAGDRFDPVLVLQPVPDNLIEQRYGMITLVRGELTLERVHLEFRVGDEPVDRWSLFGMDNVELLSLFQCTLTIRNDDGRRAARHPGVAFFQVGANDQSGTPAAAGDVAAKASAIDLVECIARGEATLVRTTAAVPMRLSWSNGLLVTTERLLEVTGSTWRPEEGSYIEIDLDHVTAVVDDGLALLDAGQANPHQRLVAFHSTNSILMTHPGAALVEQRGPGDLETIAKPFLFSGRLNFYPEAQQVFRLIESTTDPEARRLDDFSAWTRTWDEELLPHREVVWVQLPPKDQPVHLLTEVDYAIVEKSSNFAFRPLGDRSNAGYGNNLPQLPPDEPFAPPVSGGVFPLDGSR